MLGSSARNSSMSEPKANSEAKLVLFRSVGGIVLPQLISVLPQLIRWVGGEIKNKAKLGHKFELGTAQPHL